MTEHPTAGGRVRALGAVAHDAAELTSQRRGAKVRVRPTQDVAGRLSASAIRLFGERGFDAVSVSEIAAEAGVTPRTFFRYYPTKETVLVDIVDHTNDRLIQIIQVVRPGAGIAEVLRSALSAWFTEYAELFSEVTSLSETSPSLMAAFLFRFAEWERRLAEALRTRYPGLCNEDALVWAMIAFGLLRLAPPFASLRGSSFADAVNEVFDRFEALATAGHEPGIDPAQR